MSTEEQSASGEVRLGTIHDLPEIMRLCRQLHQENAIFSMSDERVEAMLRLALRGPNGEKPEGTGIVGVIDGPNGTIEAMILMMMTQMWYSDEHYLEECLSYVDPAFRRSDRAKKLVGFAKAISDRSGLPLIIGILSNERTEAKVKLYQRQLGAPAGAFFLHGRRTGQASAA